MKQDRRIVGATKLRRHLGEYLRAVARGEAIVIGDRNNRPVARLVPVVRSPSADVLDRLAAEGVLQRGVGKPGRMPRVKMRRGRGQVADLVCRDRR